MEWYAKAAKQGNAIGQLNVGYLFDKGFGVKGDDVVAVQWYLKAALQNNDIAQNNLAYMYKTGGGVEKDMVKSLAWRILAAQSGNEKGRVFREIDAKEMTPALIEEAEELAERLLKK